MRKLILNVAVSLDGLIEGPNGEYDWCFTDQDYGMKAFFNRIDAVFMGRKSYDLMLSLENGMSDFPKMEQYVFSNTLQEPASGWTLVQGNVAEQVHEIKNRPGKDIWLFGGAALTANLLSAGLVDELSLAVHPIVLGQGKPLFSSIPERLGLHLLEAKTYSSGMVILTYTLSS